MSQFEKIHNRALKLSLLIVFAVSVSTRAAGRWDTRFDLPGASDGRVQSLVDFGGSLYAVGPFTRFAGVSTRGAARWNGTNWIAFDTPSGITMQAAAATGDAIYFAGHSKDNSRSTFLFRWQEGGWTLIKPPPEYQGVRSEILLADGNAIYAEVLPASSPSGFRALAKWDGGKWTILADTDPARETGRRGLAIVGGEIYACGPLSSKSGSMISLGRLVNGQWEPVGGGAEFLVYSIATDGRHLFARGQLTLPGNTPSGLAVWDGARWRNLYAPGRDVQALSSGNGEVITAEVTREESSNRLLSITELVSYQGTNRTVLGRGEAEHMTLLKRRPEGIYCAGNFRSVSGVHTGNLALWTGTQWTKAGPSEHQGLSDQATALAVSGANVYVAGRFEFAGGVRANGVARWDGRRWHALGNGIESGRVTGIAARGSEVLVLRVTDIVGSPPQSHILRWDGSTWTQISQGLRGQPNAITATETEFLAAITSGQRIAIARWDGSSWTNIIEPSTGVLTGQVRTMLSTPDEFFVGGYFWNVSGTIANVARWRSDQWLPMQTGVSGTAPPSRTGFNSLILEAAALLWDGKDLYAGGSFTMAGGRPASNVARWNGQSWAAMGTGIPGFGICEINTHYCSRPVTSMAFVQGKLFAAGGKNALTGQILSAWDGSEWTRIGDWAYDFGRPERASDDQIHIWAMGSHGQELFLAGNFGTVSDVVSHGFAIWHEPEPAKLRARLAEGRAVLSWPLELEPAALEFTDSLSNKNWQPAANLPGHVRRFTAGGVEVRLEPSARQRFYRLR